MNRNITTSLLLAGALTLCAGVVRGQEAPPPAPEALPGGPGMDSPPGPFGERIELLGFAGMHPGKVVTGAPFSAVAVTETAQTLADGNHITRKTQANLFRDSQGRVRREGTFRGFGPLAAEGQSKSFVVIHDPVAGSVFILHPDTKTAENMGNAHGKLKGTFNEGMNNKQSKMEAREQEEIASGKLKKEDLGTQTIGGIVAQGTRLTRIIPAGQIGNEKPISIVHERWYSNDLQMLVMSKRSDPWSGETTYTLTNIQRAEPSASLFTVPSDYSVQQGRPGKRMMLQNQAPPQLPDDNEF